MERVWIVTTKLEYGSDEFIEGVFDSYELAHMAAEDIWRKLEPPYHSYLWKYKEWSAGGICQMAIWTTSKETFEEKFFATIKINPFPVWH